MPYKIIETREKGQNLLQVVPAKWERNNILHWPRRNVEKLLEMEHSCPDDSWVTFTCNVKRSNLISKESAEIEVARMSDMSDTDADEERLTQKQCLINNNTAIQECFNNLTRSCLEENASTVQSPIPETTTALIHLPESSNDVLDHNVIYLTTDEPTKSAETTAIIQKIDSLIEKIKSLEEGQNVLCNIMQNLETNLLKKIAQITTTFEAFVEHCSKDSSSVKANTIDFVKITDKKSLDEFEENLKNLSFRTQIKNQLSLVCGKGKGRANNNAYALSDVIFNRNFLTLCFWSGGSRNQCSKICFKVYTNTVDLFFDLIYESDPNYTKQECHTFLKNIMRHSNTRNKEIKRMATSKCKSKQPTKSKAMNVASQSNTAVKQPTADTDNQLISCSRQHITVAKQCVGADDQTVVVQPVDDTGDQLISGSKKQPKFSL